MLLGRFAAQVARRLRLEADPEQWSRTVVDFRSRVSSGLPGKLPRSMVALVLMVIADATILALALRFMGLDADSAPRCCSSSGPSARHTRYQPFRLFGFGVLDAALLGAIVPSTGGGRPAGTDTFAPCGASLAFLGGSP